MSSSVGDMVDCKTLLLGSQKVGDVRCGLQILQSCGLAVADFKIYEFAVADFKNYEVADLRLWIQEF